jgi:hypothetical protein
VARRYGSGQYYRLLQADWKTSLSGTGCGDISQRTGVVLDAHEVPDVSREIDGFWI